MTVLRQAQHLGSAAYISGTTNTEADEESRRENQDSEWMSNPDVLSDALDRLHVKPKIDLLASRLNHVSQVRPYKPDPDAEAGYAFTMSWSDTIQYNTTLLSLCRGICFLARHLHKNIQ